MHEALILQTDMKFSNIHSRRCCVSIEKIVTRTRNNVMFFVYYLSCLHSA